MAAYGDLTCVNGWRVMRIEIRTDYDKRLAGKDGKVREKSVDKGGRMW